MSTYDGDALTARIERAPYGADLGVRVELLESERVRLRVPYKDENSNPGRALHGGVAASIINIAGAAVSAAASGASATAESGTVDLSVIYLAAAIGEDIIAAAEVLRRGKEIVYSDVDVRNPAGKRIAKGLVTHRTVDAAGDSGASDRQLARSIALPPLPEAEMLRGARGFMMVPFIARRGMKVEHAHNGSALVRLPPEDHNVDHDGGIHEGALAALIDTTGALASWSLVGLNLQYKASTVGIHVTYHARVSAEDAVARAVTLRRNDEIFLNQVTVAGAASGRVVATGTVTYRIVVTA